MIMINIEVNIINNIVIMVIQVEEIMPLDKYNEDKIGTTYDSIPTDKYLLPTKKDLWKLKDIFIHW